VRGASAPRGGGEGREHIVAAARLQLVTAAASTFGTEADKKRSFGVDSFSVQKTS